MIVFDLACGDGHRFEGWFASSDDFATQHAGGLVSCPSCGSRTVAKAPMAPAVPRKGNQLSDTSGKAPVMSGPIPAEISEALKVLAQAQAKALENSTWVGDDFAEATRAMHYGERDPETIHGRADADEAIALIEEGIPIAPLPFPVAPPDQLN
jgi:hypothetical protein